MSEAREYQIALYRAPDCTRGWLAYVWPSHVTNTKPDLVVTVEAKGSSQAKSRAITMARSLILGLDYDLTEPTR